MRTEKIQTNISYILFNLALWSFVIAVICVCVCGYLWVLVEASVQDGPFLALLFGLPGVSVFSVSSVLSLSGIHPASLAYLCQLRGKNTNIVTITANDYGSNKRDYIHNYMTTWQLHLLRKTVRQLKALKQLLIRDCCVKGFAQFHRQTFLSPFLIFFSKHAQLLSSIGNNRKLDYLCAICK